MILRHLLCSEEPDQYLTDCPQVVEDRLTNACECKCGCGKEEEGEDIDDQGTTEYNGQTNVRLPTDGSVEAGQIRLCGWLIKPTNCVHQPHPSTNTISPIMSNAILEDRQREPILEPPRDPYTSKCILGLHPQILATCRMLYAEGKHILYEDKTVTVTYFADENIRPRAYILGEESVREAIMRYPALKQIKRWAIDIFSDCEQRIYDYQFACPGGSLLWSRLLFSDIDTLLASVGTMKSLELSFTYLPGPDTPPHDHYDLYYPKMLCSPFRLLISRECFVTIYGHKGRSLERTIAGHVTRHKSWLEPVAFLGGILMPLLDDVVAHSDKWCREHKKPAHKKIKPYSRMLKFDITGVAGELFLKVQVAIALSDFDEFLIKARNLLGFIQIYATKALAFLEEREWEEGNLKMSDEASSEHNPRLREGERVHTESVEGLVTEQTEDADPDSIAKQKTQIILFAIQAGKFSRQLKEAVRYTYEV